MNWECEEPILTWSAYLLENMSLNGLWAEKWAVQELKMSRCGLWVGPKKGSEAKEFNEGYNCQVGYRTREDRK